MEFFIVPSLLLIWVNNTATTGSTPGIRIIIVLQRLVKSLAKRRFDRCPSMYRPSGRCLPSCYGKDFSAWIVPVLCNLIGNKYCSKCNRYYLALLTIGKQSVCWGQFIVCAVYKGLNKRYEGNRCYTNLLQPICYLWNPTVSPGGFSLYPVCAQTMEQSFFYWSRASYIL